MPRNSLAPWLEPTVCLSGHTARVFLPTNSIDMETAAKLTHSSVSSKDLTAAAIIAGLELATTGGTIDLVLRDESDRQLHCYALANDPSEKDGFVFLGTDQPTTPPFHKLPLSISQAVMRVVETARTERDVWNRLVELRDADSQSDKERIWLQFIRQYPPLTSEDEPRFLRQARDLLIRVRRYNEPFRLSFALDDFPDEPQAVRLSAMRSQLPHGVLVDSEADMASAQHAVAALLTNTHRRLARDNTYTALKVAMTADGPASRLLVCWEPHGEKTPYLHLRKAVEHQLPEVLNEPRHGVSHPSDQKLPPTSSTAVVGGFAPRDPFDNGASDGDQLIRPPEAMFSDVDEIARKTKLIVAAEGFEAFGWYAPWHFYDEATWGIYLHAERLEALSLTVWQDASRDVSVPYELAAEVVVRKVYDHEMFHARVEAAAAFIELTSRVAKLRPYHATVYKQLFGTAKCLEEALANHHAYAHLERSVPCLCKSHDRGAVFGIRQAVIALMDLSPPGYRDWRIGNRPEAWCTLAAELCKGTPCEESWKEKTPTECLLTDALPVDLRPADVPVYVYGVSATMSGLMAQPSCFGVPSRRELRKALKHQGYNVLPGRGKGSHELWQHPDERTCPVPQTDPVSRDVFGTFLAQCGLTKADYIREIRPLL